MTTGISKMALKYLYSLKDLGHELIFVHFRNDFFFVHLKADLLWVDNYEARFTTGKRLSFKIMPITKMPSGKP